MASNNTSAFAFCEQFIRRPASDVFQAFVRPELLTRFWLRSASAPLKAGARVRWEFLVPGAVDELEVLVVEPDRRIEVRSADGTIIRWTFTRRTDSETLVSIEQTGYNGPLQECAENAIEATQGFTLVLSALKILLETGRDSGLVQDKARLIEEHQQGKGAPRT